MTLRDIASFLGGINTFVDSTNDGQVYTYSTFLIEFDKKHMTDFFFLDYFLETLPQNGKSK